MADKEFLKYFITEPVYLIPENEPTKVEEPAESIKKEVKAEPKKLSQPEEINEPIKIIGNNSKKVLVLIDEPDVESINSSNEAFLTKILQAVKLDIKDIAIVNVAQNPGVNRDSSLAFGATKYLVFGVIDEKLFKDHLPPYQIIEMETKQILSCSSLSEIANDKRQKTLLWDALQKMFL